MRTEKDHEQVGVMMGAGLDQGVQDPRAVLVVELEPLQLEEAQD